VPESSSPEKPSHTTILRNYELYIHGVTNGNLDDYLGSWGVDVVNNRVWAVIDHGGQFAVVPEPSSLVLTACGAAALTFVALKRRREIRRAKRTRLARTALRFQAVPTTPTGLIADWQTQAGG